MVISVYEEISTTDPPRSKNTTDDTTPTGDIEVVPAYTDLTGQSRPPEHAYESVGQSNNVVRPLDGSNDQPTCFHYLVRQGDAAPITQTTERTDSQNTNQRQCDVRSATSASSGERSGVASLAVTEYGYVTCKCCRRGKTVALASCDVAVLDHVNVTTHSMRDGDYLCPTCCAN